MTNAPKEWVLHATHIWKVILQRWTDHFFTIFLELRPGQGHSNPETKHQTLQPQDVSTYQIWESYIQVGYGPDTIFLELRQEVK